MQLGDDVLFGQHLHRLVFAAAGAVVLDHGAGHFSVAQPGANGRHLGQRLRVEYRTHGTTVGVATDDDVVNFKRHYGVLDGAGNATVHLAIRRYHVTHVTGHEQVAWRALGDQLGNDARIGTGDEHRAWCLRGGELLEQLLLIRENIMVKAQEAVDDVLKGSIGAFRGDLRYDLGWVLDGHDSSS
ncbi:hypothetical protein D3C80_1026780 [compost metagenome]